MASKWLDNSFLYSKLDGFNLFIVFNLVIYIYMAFATAIGMPKVMAKPSFSPRIKTELI